MDPLDTSYETLDEHPLYRLINGNREVVCDSSYFFDNRYRIQREEGSFWVLQYTVRGQAVFEDATGTKAVQAGEAMLFRYGEDSRYGYDAESNEPYWHKFIGFSGHDVDSICNWIRQRFGPIVRLGVHSAADRLLDRLLQALVATDRNRFYESALLYRLWMEILTGTPELKGRPDRVMQAHDLVEDRFREPITVSTIAQYVGWSREHLAREYRSRFGISISSVLRERRLHEAQRLLTVSNESVESICLRCGYVDVSTFIRAFRLRFGYPPGSMRKKKQAMQDLSVR